VDRITVLRRPAVRMPPQSPDLSCLLMAPPGVDPEGLEAAHQAIVACLPPLGPHRFTLLAGPIGSRDAVGLVCDAVYRTLRHLPAGDAVTVVASFRESAGDAALFDALLWGQCEAMVQVDRLRYPRAAGSAGGLSLAGRRVQAEGRHPHAGRPGDRAPLDTLVLRFDPVHSVTAPSPAP